jgi:hypothetical protein
VLPSFSILIPNVKYSAMTFEITLLVSDQTSINSSSLPTVPLNRVSVRTVVQGKQGLTTVLPSLSIIIPYVNYSA